MIFDRRLTKAEMRDLVKDSGLRRTYRPFMEGVEGAFFLLLETNRPPEIQDGELHGTEIFLYDAKTFRVWSDKTVLGARLIRERGLAGHSRDGEVEVLVPGALGDDVFRLFGARSRQPMSPERLAKLREMAKRGRIRVGKGLPESILSPGNTAKSLVPAI